MRFKGSRVQEFKGWFLILFLCVTSVAAAQPSSGVVGEVRVHGNHTTPDADIFTIVGDVVGKPASDALIAEITDKLERSGRFDGVEVRKRYRSIADPDDVLLMVIVDEVPGVDELDLMPGPMKRFRSSGMFLPILHYDDGYGFTYGARISFVDRLGPRSRISVPLSWGGERQARLQLERTFKAGPIDRVAGEFGIGRRENPHYEIGDTRTSFNARVEGALARWLRFGAGGGVDDVEFGDANDRLDTFGADATIDTRVDPAFPRNAVHAKFGWERLRFDAGRANRNTVDVRGYLGLVGPAVLALRGQSVTSDHPLPAFEHVLLGGPSSLRGFDTGYKASDNIAAASAEIRIPLTSPLSIGRFGVKVFADTGTAYAHGEKLSNQRLDAGFGGGVYLHLTLISMGLDVAKGRDAGTKFHFGMGVTFK
jgi:outer membrane protein assembly factor BamA